MLITSLYLFWWHSELSEPFKAKTSLYYFAAGKPPVVFHCTERPKSFQGPARPSQTWLPPGLSILILFRPPLLLCAPSMMAFLAPNSFLSGDLVPGVSHFPCLAEGLLFLHASSSSSRSLLKDLWEALLPPSSCLFLLQHSSLFEMFFFFIFLTSYKHKTVECTDCHCMLSLYSAMPSRQLVSVHGWLS